MPVTTDLHLMKNGQHFNTRRKLKKRVGNFLHFLEQQVRDVSLSTTRPKPDIRYQTLRSKLDTLVDTYDVTS